MKIISTLTPAKYIRALRYGSESIFHFGAERFTGIFLWRFFYITHHAGYEWNRRYTNEKNAALGFVRGCDEGCQVSFIRFKGALCPGQIIFNLLFVSLLLFIQRQFEVEALFTLPVIFLVVFAGIFIVGSLVATFFESLTERSMEGEQILLARLADPVNPYT